MKRIPVFILSAILALSLCACGCSNTEPATTPTTNPTVVTTEPTTMPTETMTVPVPETNIPDSDVAPSESGENTTTDATGSTDSTNTPNGDMSRHMGRNRIH